MSKSWVINKLYKRFKMDDFREDYAVIDVDYFKGQILVIDQNNEKFTYWKKLGNNYKKYMKATKAYLKGMADYQDLIRRCKML